MLPSFRLIAATFLCGFVVVFAGLRMAASLNDIHEGLPVMAAHAAPVSIMPVADQDMRRALTAVPVMYDLRFVSHAWPTPTRASMSDLVTDRAAPLGLPLVILPPESTAAPEAAAPAEPESTVAAIQPDAPVILAPAAAPAAIDVPAEPPKTEAPQVEMPRTETPAVAAIAPQPASPPEPVAAAPVIAAPAPEVLAPAAPAADPAPAIISAAIDPQAAPEMEAEQLVPEPDTTASVDAPATAAAVPLPKPQAAKSAPKAKVKAKAVAKAKVVRKKHVRTARRATTNTSGAFGSSAANPFGIQ